MHRRTPSLGTITGDGLGELTNGRLPPRLPFAALHGFRTPSTCPTSPLVGLGAGLLGAAVPLTAGGRSSGSTPARSRRTSCNALAMDLPQSHVLPNIVTSVFESNVTAEQCFSTYGRMHNAPPLVGHGGGRSHSASAASAGGIMHATRPSDAHSMGSAGAQLGMALANDVNDGDFGLATCLATPMDPGPGLQRRLVQLPVTTTAAARTAATKLTSANDILQEASRYGDWVRRQGRRRKLARMQGVLAGMGSNVVLGRLMDDTLHEYDPVRSGIWDELSGGRQASRNDLTASSGVATDQRQVDTAAVFAMIEAGEVDLCSRAELEAMLDACRSSDSEEEQEEGEFPARLVRFRDDMALVN